MEVARYEHFTKYYLHEHCIDLTYNYTCQSTCPFQINLLPLNTNYVMHPKNCLKHNHLPSLHHCHCLKAKESSYLDILLLEQYDDPMKTMDGLKGTMEAVFEEVVSADIIRSARFGVVSSLNDRLRDDASFSVKGLAMRVRDEFDRCFGMSKLEGDVYGDNIPVHYKTILFDDIGDPNFKVMLE